jgi:kinesin family protein 1
MIAAISPADYDETLSTLRYADQAKKIRTKAVVNEDPTAKVMRELKDEVEALRQALMVYAPEEVEKITATAHPVKGQKKQAPPAAAAAVAGAGATLTPPKTPSPSKSTVVFTDANGNTTQLTKDEMVDQLKVTEKLLTDMNQTWEEKLQNTEKIHVERENTLKKLGITIEKNEVGVYTPKEIPYMINLNEDPLMSECLMYHIKTGKTFVVRLDENTTELPSPPPEETTDEEKGVIRLSGTNIRDKHCYFENINDTVTLYPGEDCTTMVNGRRISEPKLLKSGYRIILGDNHVFRFNNPGEAMREREQQMQQADEVQRNTDSPSPPSPTSESQSLTSALGSSEVMDWNFARREAMLNTYINDSNFGNFTDEDLDKLFDDVSKVRVLRKRQSTSSDTLSRRTSTSSVRRSTYSTSNSLFTEDPIDGYYTTDTSTISSTTSSSRESLLMMAQDERDFQLEHHRRKYEAKLRRLSRRLSQAPLTFTKAETTLGRKVIQLWKKKRHVAMAQVMFSNIENLNQANKMAAKAGKGVSYQFTVVHDNASAYSLSYWDTNNPSHNAQRATDLALLKESKPCVGIKVIDKKHQSTYIWSMDKFLSRQRHLKGAYYSTDSKKQMKGEDLYYDTVVPAYSLVGLASVPLKNLATQVPVDSTLSIYCKNTGKFKGTVKVLIAPIARSVRQPYHSDREDEHDIIDDQPSNLLHVGQQLVFEVRVVEITGINPEEFSHVHAQFRLSTFGSNLDRVFASEPYKQKSSDSLFFDYHQTLSMTVTEDMLYIIENKDIAFEIYGKPKPGYLDLLSDSHVAEPSALPPKKTQDIIAQIQVCEITAEGDYKPVPVESNPNNEFTNDIFSLQQGQQRRVALTIQHGSHDQEVRFDKIVNLRIGHVRLMDNKNRVTESPSQMEIPLNLIATTSSSTEISAQGSWDSSLHDTIFLNTITPSTHKVLLNLSWTLRNKSQCDIKFEKEIAVVIKDQSKAASLKKKTKRNSVIMNFFSLKPSNIKSQVTALYMVEHVAEMMGVSQLWKQHQATERLLRSYDEGRQKMQRREEVELVRYRLYLTDQLLNPTLEDGEQKVVKTIQPLGVATPESILNIWMSSKAEPTIPESQPKVSRWVPKVHQVVLTGDGVSKKGFLTRKKRSDGNETEKLWCTLLG